MVVSVFEQARIRCHHVRDSPCLASAVPFGAFPVDFPTVRVVLDVAMAFVHENAVSAAGRVGQLRQSIPGSGVRLHFLNRIQHGSNRFRFDLLGYRFHLRLDELRNVANLENVLVI